MSFNFCTSGHVSSAVSFCASRELTQERTAHANQVEVVKAQESVSERQRDERPVRAYDTVRSVER